MNKEQNIDDILKLLKDSVSQSAEDSSEAVTPNFSENISDEMLQQQLKNQYSQENTSKTTRDYGGNEYIIDSEFLNDASALDAQETEEVKEEQTVIPKAEELAEEKNDIVIEQMSLFGEAEHTVIKVDSDTEEQENENVLVLKQVAFTDASELEDSDEDEIEQLELLELPNLLEDSAVQETESEELSEEIGEEIAEEIVEEIAEEIATDDAKEAKEDAPIAEKPTAPEEPHETFLASMRKTGIDFTTDDIFNSAMRNNAEAELSEDTEEEESVEEENLSDKALDDSTINLMMQFCEPDELEKTIGEQNVTAFLKAQNDNVDEADKGHISEGKEYVSHAQGEQISEKYKRRIKVKLRSVLVCAIITVVAMILDLLPLTQTTVVGILNYKSYPIVYVFLGLQLVVLAAALRYKEYWQSLKLAFLPTPTYQSLVSVVLSLTALYDVLCVILLFASENDSIPFMYNGVAILALTLALLYEYLELRSDAKSFEIYSSDTKKYTLIKETQDGSIGKKMYGGGLDSEKNIYSVRDIDFPSGFFKSIKKKTIPKGLIFIGIIPMLLLGAIGTVVSIFADVNPYASCAAFIICAYAIQPIPLMLSSSIIKFICVQRLAKRGIAISGDYSVKKHSDADVMIFDDLHIFKKCRTEDIGIVMYDTKVGYLTLGCLDALYTKIGGPLSGMEMNLPDVFKFDNVAIRRITRNGIEAVIDAKHTIIVGEYAFMQRYGLAFPQNELKNGRCTLCVSLDGKVTAKLSIKYETEPIFEMLVERLYKEGVLCAIRTYDPLINSGVIASARTLGSSPVSVIHGDANDFALEGKKRYRQEADGIIALSSRLKLCEAEVWIKRLEKIRKGCTGIAVSLMVLGTLAYVLLTLFGVTQYISYGYILAYLVLSSAAMCAYALSLLPAKKYFTVDKLYSEVERAELQRQAEERRERSEKLRKITTREK